MEREVLVEEVRNTPLVVASGVANRRAIRDRRVARTQEEAIRYVHRVKPSERTNDHHPDVMSLPFAISLDLAQCVLLDRRRSPA